MDNKSDYKGALVTRVNSLTNGLNGIIFSNDDIPDEDLFDKNVIIDLSRVGSTETKALIMGVLVLKLQEYRMSGDKPDNAPLKHITVLEEAHNLLKNVNNSQGASAVIAKSVEMICNSIAEMRTYGESFILVDQSPSAVDIAAIKNTNTKIIMRLPEAGDCEAIGKSVSLNPGQIAELSKLRTGAAVVMQNNWCDAVLAQIHRHEYPYSGPVPSSTTKRLMSFKSAVLGELLNEYAIARTRNVARIMEVIEYFDIDAYKKKDAVCMVNSITSQLDKKWDSVAFGNALLQYAGAEGIFRRAEQNTPDIPKRGAENTEDVSDSVNSLFDFLNSETDKMLEITEKQKRTLLQYLVYAKAHDENAVDYDMIYRTRYVR
jgi:hypothetical protein